MFSLVQLLKTLWQIIRSLLGSKSESCENKEYDCRNLTKAIENEKKCCNIKVGEEQNKFQVSCSQQGTRNEGLLQVECDGNSDTKLANTCSSHLIGTVECNAQCYPEETQHRRVTLETNVLNPNIDISEPSTPNAQEFYTGNYEPDPYCHRISTREIVPTYDPCFCYPNPCVCNYKPRTGWDSDYYARYSRNMGRNDDWRLLCQYDVDRTFTSNYSQGHYTPKTTGRYDVRREDSVEFLYSRTNKPPVENFHRDLRPTLSPKRQQQFEPKHHSTRNETHVVSNSSPVRSSPEQSPYGGTEYVDNGSRIDENTTHSKHPGSKNEYITNEYDQRILDNDPTNGKINVQTRTETNKKKNEYITNEYDQGIFDNDPTNGKSNAQTRTAKDHNSRVDRILQKETATNHIQVQTDDVAIFSTADELQPSEIHNKKNHSIIKASKERQNTTKSRTLARADPNSVPNKYDIEKPEGKVRKIVKHHADLSERSQVENTSQEFDFTRRKNEHSLTEDRKSLKIKMHDLKKRFYSPDESKVHKYVSVKTNTDSPLSTVIQTGGNIPYGRQCPRNCEQRTKDNQHTLGKTQDYTTPQSSSDDSKQTSTGK